MSRLSVIMLSVTLAVAALACAPAAYAQSPAPHAHSPARAGETDASLSGIVVDQNQTPLFHARVTLENGLWSASAEDGSFRIDGVSAGKHDVKITARGHHTGEKVVTFSPGQQMTMMVMLTSNNPTAAKPPEKKSTFYIQAYEYRYGSKRYYVKHVQVSEYEDPMKSWSKYLWNGNDGPGFYMPCEDATFKKHYNVTITWHTMPNPDGMNDDEELTGTWYKSFDTEWETWTFYSPY